MSGSEKYETVGDILAEQRAYSTRVGEMLRASLGREPKAFVHTYGCQQNVSDSEHIEGLLLEMGYSLCSSPEEADFILFNTCAVREHAEDRVFGNVGALKAAKQNNPALLIALCGCMTQQPHIAERLKKSYPYVDIVFGTHDKHRLPEFIYRRLTGGRVFESSDCDEIIEGLPVHRSGSANGWLPIMYGCNNFCTYCVVPYVRSRERSRDPAVIIEEARSMIASGIKDITLLGQNVNSYGKGESHGVDFAGLLRLINDIPGDFRIRFMTSHPKDCTDRLLIAMSECEKVCRHLHLPFQSGSDEILRRMNRRYTADAYLRIIDRARELMPDILFTSDVIVGFPGETREDFDKTMSLIDRVKFYSLYTFIFSPRRGTPAAEMDDPVPRNEKGRWFAELLRLQEGIKADISRSFIGSETRVLCDDCTDDGLVLGRGRVENILFEGRKDMVGTFQNIRVTAYEGGALKGKII